MIINDLFNNKKFVAEGQLELNTPDPVVVVQDLKGKILDKINLSVAAQKYKLGQPQNIKNQLAHQNYTTIGNYVIVSPMSGQPQDATTTGQKNTFATGVAEDDDAVAAFLARGGEVQKLKSAKPRKGERWQGSSHIGAAGGRGTKGRVSGLAANTGKSGKPVVTAEDSSPTHRIGLTVTDPNHPMVSKRGETYQKSVRVTGPDREAAINQAIAHYRRKGYKVHDHHYLGTVDQGVAEGKKPDNYHIVNKDGKPASLASYADRASAEKDRDEKHPGAEVRQVGPRGKVKNVSEVSRGDYRNKAMVSQAGAKIKKFLDRDDPAAVASADQTIAKREKGLARADARVKAYTPPAAEPADLEKQQRDLTAKYPNIDELVRRAELNRDPNYEYADGQAYYTARDAEQNYQKLKQIQRVIQGLNESLNRSHLP